MTTPTQAPALPPLHFRGPAAWHGADVAASPDWIHPLTPDEQEEVIALGERLAAHGLSLEEAASLARRDSELLPRLRSRLAKIRLALQKGVGFSLLRGVPVQRMSPAATRLAYMAIGAVLGLAMPQNKRGELLHDVRDTGADRHDLNVRLSTTTAEQDFHTDGADLIGLLCLQTSKSGGTSRIVSSVSVYNEVARLRPDLAPLLFEPWYFHMKNEQPDGAPPYFRLPVAHVIQGQLSSFFIGWYMRHAETLPGVPPLTPSQRELLDLYEATANQPGLFLDMAFEPGDIQFLKNSAILHKRTEYEDWPEPERKRHLLRLWLAADDFDDGIVTLRRGHSASLAQADAAHGR